VIWVQNGICMFSLLCLEPIIVLSMQCKLTESDALCPVAVQSYE